MAKTVSFGAKPNPENSKRDPEAWVSNAGTASSASPVTSTLQDSITPAPKPMKRLTIDISEELHRRIKIVCAEQGTHIADEVRQLLEQRFLN